MQSYDHGQNPGPSDQYFQGSGKPRVSLPPASSFFESAQPSHQNPSAPFHPGSSLVESSNETYLDQQYGPNYVDPSYSMNSGISPNYGQGYGGVYDHQDVRYGQLEMYPPQPLAPIPMMQPPAPPEYPQPVLPSTPMMYPPNQYHQWNQTEYGQNPAFNQPILTELKNYQTTPAQTPTNTVNRPQDSQPIVSQFQEGIHDSNFRNFQNTNMESFQQIPPQGFNPNPGFLPPQTSEYSNQPQYPQQGPSYPDPRTAPVDQPITKSESSIADTVAEVIAKQKAKIFEEEQEASEAPVSQPKKRRYVPTLDPPYPEDGPTVKEHLRQKQMEKKMQEKQEILRQKIIEDEEKRKIPKYSNLEKQLKVEKFEHVATENPSIPQEEFQISEQKIIQEKIFVKKNEIDTEIAAKIEEIGGFDGSTVGELAESIEGVPAQSTRKKKKPSKPRKKTQKNEIIQKENDEKYLFKALHLQNTVRSLVLKNTALADEVSRLVYRIKVATEERTTLARRLQHYERNRIRRVLTQKKKRQALQALQAEEEYSQVSSVEDQSKSQEFQFERNFENTEATVSAFAFDEIKKEEMAVIMPFTEMGNLDSIPILNLDDIDCAENQIEEYEVPEDNEKIQNKSKTDKNKNPGSTNKTPRRTPRKRKTINEKIEFSVKKSKIEKIEEFQDRFYDEGSWMEFEEVFNPEIPQNFISPRKKNLNRSETPSSSVDSSSRPESSQSGSMRTRSRRRNQT